MPLLLFGILFLLLAVAASAGAQNLLVNGELMPDGGGWQQLRSPWGLLAKGGKTRHKKKHSNRFIVVRRDGLEKAVRAVHAESRMGEVARSSVASLNS